ncbi:MAG: hypothetical protein JOZ77_03000 [Candidatus Eremiobacteraeota bacterium]|nr:hypothetical protein [Candidatus Eremiobacteraeota bacterium]
MMNDDIRKYIDILQATIARLAANSFQVKGWSVALGSVIIGFTAKDSHPQLAWLALIPIGAFWLLDAYYLALERLYRARYVASVPSLRAAANLQMPEVLVYDMNVGNVSPAEWFKAALSRAALPLHGSLAVVAIAVVAWGLAAPLLKS